MYAPIKCRNPNCLTLAMHAAKCIVAECNKNMPVEVFETFGMTDRNDIVPMIVITSLNPPAKTKPISVDLKG